MAPSSLDDIFEGSGAAPDTYAQFMQLVSEVVTGSMLVTNLESRLTTDLGLGDTAPTVAAQLLAFIGYTATSARPAAVPQPLHEEIVEAEAALANVAAVRTMARDMHDLKSQAPAEAPAYRSEQPSRTTPTPPTPRWDSE